MSRTAFRPRARIMKTLGEELISSDSVAIIELVKNSYDADASDVLVRFIGPLKEGEGCIKIIDNGKGMSIETVENSWMEPATPSKVNHKKSGYGRRVLGEKGIGRFAASRLASKLELISKRGSDKNEVHALFDWTQFDDDEKYLDEIEVLIESQLPKYIISGGEIECVAQNKIINTVESHGTILKISDLKQEWKSSNFDEIQRGLSRLVSPFLNLSNFRIRIEAPEGFEQYSSEISPPQIINYPHYTVYGKVNTNGTFNLKYKVLSNGEEQNIDGFFFRHPKSGWVMASLDNMKDDYIPPECGEFEIQLRVWDRDELGNVLQMVGGTISSVRKDLDNFAGINIYRDGFRVMPYGEPNNDWLRLDLRRIQKPVYKLSNNQIVGYISITADGNPGLKDQSNREGMRESQAYLDMKEIMFCILSRMEDIRFKVRKIPDSSEGDNKAKQGGLFENLDLSTIRNHLSNEHPNDVLAKNLVDNVEADFTKRIENIKKVVARYTGLATLGKLVDAVLHEGRQPLSAISAQASLGQEDLEDFGYTGEAKLESTYKRLFKVKEQSKVLNAIFKRIEPFGGRKSGRPPQLYLEKIIKDSFEIFEGQLKSSSIRYSISDSQTLVRLDPHEMQQVFVNLIDNSIYWLQFIDKKSRKISVSVERIEDGGIVIIFADSGPGVSFDDRELIFDAYYSKRNDGAGLGLSIVGEMVSNYYGGSLELLDSGELPGANFRIILSKRV